MRIFIFFYVIFSLNLLFAQQYKHEIFISSGILTSSQWRAVIDDFDHIINPGDYAYERGGQNQILLNYQYYYSEDKSYGFYFGYERYGKNIFDGSDKVGSIINREFTLAGEWSIRYLNLSWLQTYSGVGLGLTYIDQDLNKNSNLRLSDNSRIVPAYYLNLIGLKIGYRAYATFALGFGYKGELNIGLSYQF